MTTIILSADAKNGLSGSFLSSNTSATIEQARAWFAWFAGGMAESGNVSPGETLYGFTFANKTLDAIGREFPYLFEDGEWVCGCNGGLAR